VQGQNLSSLVPSTSDGSIRIIIINPIRSRIFRQHARTVSTRNEIFLSCDQGKPGFNSSLVKLAVPPINHIVRHGNPVDPCIAEFPDYVPQLVLFI
jgi:hypothetical protein